MMIKYLVLLLISITCLGGILTAQDRNIDKLEMLYDQGRFKRVINKSERLLFQARYVDHPSPYLFHALAEYQLSFYNSRYSSSAAIMDYEQFLKKDTVSYYQKSYGNYIEDLQLGLANEVRTLSTSGAGEKARVKYNTLNRIFGVIAQFDELIQQNLPIEVEVVTGGDESSNGSNSSNSGTKPVIENTSSTISKTRKQLVTYAKKLEGTPYLYGGVTPKGFDCSGFTQYVFSKNGYDIPRTSSSQGTRYEKIKLSQAQKGDLVFFGSSKQNISHVGIVSSEKGKTLTMIHASSSRGVMVSAIENDPYWKPRLRYAVKVISN